MFSQSLQVKNDTDFIKFPCKHLLLNPVEQMSMNNSNNMFWEEYDPDNEAISLKKERI